MREATPMYVWLTVEDDGHGKATKSFLSGQAMLGGFPIPYQYDLEGRLGDVVPKGSEYHQDLIEAGWRPIWARQGKSVWRASGDVRQALSDYWLLIETKRMTKEV